MACSIGMCLPRHTKESSDALPSTDDTGYDVLRQSITGSSHRIVSIGECTLLQTNFNRSNSALQYPSKRILVTFSGNGLSRLRWVWCTDARDAPPGHAPPGHDDGRAPHEPDGGPTAGGLCSVRRGLPGCNLRSPPCRHQRPHVGILHCHCWPGWRDRRRRAPAVFDTVWDQRNLHPVQLGDVQDHDRNVGPGPQRDHTGKMGFNEFKDLFTALNGWKQNFLMFDRDRSGTVEPQEMSQAVSAMGYRVSPQALNVIIRRYSKNGRVYFDDYVACCVKLRSLTDVFRRRDTMQQGAVSFQYDDFILCTMSI